MIQQKKFVRVIEEIERICNEYAKDDSVFLELAQSWANSIDMIIDPSSDICYWYCFSNDFGKAGKKYNGKIIDTPIKLFNLLKKNSEQ